MKENKGSIFSKAYAMFGIVTLVLAVVGTSIAYFSATTDVNDNTIAGQTASAANISLDVTQVLPASLTGTSGKIIPLESGEANTGTGALQFENQMDAALKNNCIYNGYVACQVYRITVTNSGSDPVTATPKVKLTYSNGFENLRWQKLTGTNSSDFAVTGTSVKNHNDYTELSPITNLTNRTTSGNVEYVVVWLEETGLVQNETGLTFDGTVAVDVLDINENQLEEQLTTRLAVTDISNFEYYLGSETSNVDSVPLKSNEVLLKKYKGTSGNVTVPDTYTINGTKYNVVIFGDGQSMNGTFNDNLTIKNVTLGKNIVVYNRDLDFNDYLVSYENSAAYLFVGCENLVSVNAIPNGVTDMTGTFSGCSSLVTAPVIPNSVTNMTSTFSECSSLVTAPVIPNSVTNMTSTFSNCTSLVNSPAIPSSVTDMTETFWGCSGLVTASEIGSGVINMTETFGGCVNLTGTIKISSPNVESVGDMFIQYAYNSINVLVPAGTTTYNTFEEYIASLDVDSITLSTFE